MSEPDEDPITARLRAEDDELAALVERIAGPITAAFVDEVRRVHFLESMSDRVTGPILDATSHDKPATPPKELPPHAP